VRQGVECVAVGSGGGKTEPHCLTGSERIYRIPGQSAPVKLKTARDSMDVVSRPGQRRVSTRARMCRNPVGQRAPLLFLVWYRLAHLHALRSGRQREREIGAYLSGLSRDRMPWLNNERPGATRRRRSRNLAGPRSPRSYPFTPLTFGNVNTSSGHQRNDKEPQQPPRRWRPEKNNGRSLAKRRRKPEGLPNPSALVASPSRACGQGGEGEEVNGHETDNHAADQGPQTLVSG